MGIHFFAIGNSNIVEVQHGERAFKDASLSALPRQPEASKRYNAASVRPESCAVHYLLHIVFEIESWNLLADITLALLH